VPGHEEEGQLWTYNYSSNRAYQIHVNRDNWQADNGFQNFAVAGGTQPYNALGHDSHNLWVGGYSVATMSVYDDGVTELSWIGVSPEEGSLGADENMDVTVHLDVAGIPESQMMATLHFLSNDNEAPDYEIPVVVNVSGSSDIEITWPDEWGFEEGVVNFNGFYGEELYHGGPYSLDVEVSNVGTEVLVVDAFGCDDDHFVADPAEFEVAVDESQIVTITFESADDGPTDYQGTFLVANNSFSHPEYEFNVAAHATNPPIMTINSESFEYDEGDETPYIRSGLLTGQQEDHTVTIGNDGDASLWFEIESEITLEQGPPEGRDEVGRTLRRTNGELPVRDDAGDLIIQLQNINSANSYVNLGGYDWDNEQMWVTSYSPAWARRYSYNNQYGEVQVEVQINTPNIMDGAWWGGIFYCHAGLGSATMNRYDADGQAMQALQFGHNIYGVAADVDENLLFVQESGNNYQIHVYPLNENGTVGNRLGTISNWTQYNGNLYGIGIEWVHTHPDGQLWTYNYSANRAYQIHVDTEQWTADAGIQNFAVAGGQQPYNALGHDLHNLWVGGYSVATMSIYDDGVTEAFWLIVDPADGVIAPGENPIDVMVRLDATGLYDGPHAADVMIHGNDPAMPDFTFKIELDVTGVGDIDFAWEGQREDEGHYTLYYNDPDWYPMFDDEDDVFAGGPYTITIEAMNLGTADLTIDGVANDAENPVFTVDHDFENEPVVVAVGQSVFLDVIFFAEEVGDYNEVLTFHSDDPDEENFEIGCQANASDPPVLQIDPPGGDHFPASAEDAEQNGGFYIDLVEGDDDTRDFTIDNVGASVLYYMLELEKFDAEDVEGGRDNGGRALRRTNGEVEVNRDDAGDLLAEVQNINAANSYVHPAGFDWDNNRMWITSYSPAWAKAYSFNNDYSELTQEVQINTPNIMDGAWWGGIFYTHAGLGSAQMNRYDEDGGALQALNFGYGIYGVAADVNEDLLFVQESGNNYGIHVYPLNDDGTVGNQIGLINNWTQYNGNTYAYGCEWAPGDEDGQLWMYNYANNSAYSIHVDTEGWQADATLLSFGVNGGGQPYDAIAHDAENIWAGGYSSATIRIYDDGISEVNWIWIEEGLEAGTIQPDGSRNITLFFASEGLLGGNYYVKLWVITNDPSHNDAELDMSVAYIWITMRVTGAAHILVSPGGLIFDEESGEYVQLPPINFGVAYFWWDENDELITFPKPVPVDVINVGTDRLQIDAVESESEYFYVDEFDLPFVVGVGDNDTAPLNIWFAPDEVNEYQTVLHFYTNDDFWQGDEGYTVIAGGGENEGEGAFGLEAPIIAVDDAALADGVSLGPAEVEEAALGVENLGGSELWFNVEIILPEDEERDAGRGRALRRTDGTVEVDRDDPGDLIFSYDNINAANVYVHPVAFDWEMEGMWITSYSPAWARLYTYDRNYENIQQVVQINTPNIMDGAWWGGMFYTHSGLGSTVMNRYNAEGQAVQSLNFNHNIYGIAADVVEDLLFVQESGNNYAIHVYPLNEDGTVGNQIGLINNWTQYNGNTYAYGCEWVPDHPDGQLWMYNYSQNAAYQIHVDTENWQADATIQSFNVGGGQQPYDAVGHDGRNLWAGGYGAATIRVYDDGVAEVRWIGVEPEEGILEAGNNSLVVVTLNSTGMPAGEYTADIVFYSNDPSHGQPDNSYNDEWPDVIVPVFLEVRGEPGIATHPGIDPIDDAEDYVAGIDMPNTYIDTEYRYPMEIENTGNVEMTITRVEGTDEFWFDLNVDELAPIQPFQAIDVDLVFRPNETGDRQGEVHIYSDAENIQDGHMWTTVTGFGELAPEVIVHENDIADDEFIHQQARLGADPWSHTIEIENPAGQNRRDLMWEVSFREVDPEDGRDLGPSRTLQRTDGSVEINRDDPGDLIASFDGINTANQYVNAAGYDWDNEQMWITSYSPAWARRYSYDRNYEGYEVEVQINTPNIMDGAWWGGMFYTHAGLGSATMNRYDEEGQALQALQFGHSIYGVAADVEENILFVQESGNNYAIHVYPLNEDGTVGNQMGVINNWTQFNGNMYHYGIEWVGTHDEGQLWVYNFQANRVYEIHVDTEEWTADGATQNFAVAGGTQPYNAVGHDSKNMWVGGYSVATMNVYDDGQAELSWVEAREGFEEGSTPAGETDDIILDFNVAEIEAEGTYLADMTIETNDPVIPEVIIRLELLVGAPPLRHFTEYAGTNEFHTLVIDQVTMDGMPMPEGWEIGTYADDVLAGAEVWRIIEGMPVELHAFGDDPNTEGDEGFENGQGFLFRVWDENADMEHGAEFEVTEGSDVWQSGEVSHVNLAGFSIREQSIDLTSADGGWNLISLNVSPGDDYRYADGEFRGQLDVLAMVAGLGEALFIMKNEDGDFLFPDAQFNGIEYWDLAEGYFINVSEDVTGTWEGITIPAQTPFAINEGWNMIPYYPTYDLDASDDGGFYMLSTIENLNDKVNIVKDDQGGFAVPSISFSNMAPWTAGSGYQISVNEDFDFSYPMSQDQNAAVVQRRSGGENNAHWTGVSRTGANMSVLVSKVFGMKVHAGDQVAAFDEAGNVVGVGYFDEDGRAGLPVWGDNQATKSVVDGMEKEGTDFTLKIYSADKGLEYEVTPVSFKAGSSLTYSENGIVVLDVQATVLPTEYYIAQNFPNPFNAVTKVTFGLPEEAQVKVRVFDLAGRLVATLVDGQLKAGNHQTIWNGQDAAAGMYVIRIESSNYSRAIKAILMK
jgi:hypothetical protein